MQPNRYQDLRAWQKAIEFVERMYMQVTIKPAAAEEMFGLKSQMRRLRPSRYRATLLKARDVRLGVSSCSSWVMRAVRYTRLRLQIVIGGRLGQLAAVESDNLLAEAQELGRILNALIGSLKLILLQQISARPLTTDN